MTADCQSVVVRGWDLAAGPGRDLAAGPGRDLAAGPGRDLAADRGRDLGAGLGWDLGVGVVGGLEGEGAADPVLQRLVKLLVIPLLVGGRGDPPADVDVVAQQVSR